MKTIKQHFEEIEDLQVRTAALANMWWEDANDLVETMADAVYNGFNWSRSAEGIKYWYAYYKDLRMNEPMSRSLYKTFTNK